MERIFFTEDGSHSLYSQQFGQQYHSLQGAIRESLHIYIDLGLRPVIENSGSALSVFEMGFGTGLNALLTWQLADLLKKQVFYTSIEAFPISLEEASLLNYGALTGKSDFLKLHKSTWGEDHQLSEYFNFRKEKIKLEDFVTDKFFDVIFFDAFDPKAQPEVWTKDIFEKMASQTKPGGVLVTYSSRGIVKRGLSAAGFEIKRHPGPGKKTHVLRATRVI